MEFDVSFLAQAFPAVIAALPITCLMVVVSAPIGWLLGLGLAKIRIHRIPVASQLVVIFVSMMRSIPEVVLLYVAYFFVPPVLYNVTEAWGMAINVTAVPAVVFAILAFILNQAGYACEVLYSAILAVDPCQLEAAVSVGMKRSVAMRRIVLPQALTSALPNLNGLLVGLFQGTSLAYFIGVQELTATSVIEANMSYAYLEAYLLVTIIYEVLSALINFGFHLLEHRAERWSRMVDSPEVESQMGEAVS